MSDETAAEVSPPTDDDDLTYKFRIEVQVTPFLCCGDGEPESGMTRFSGDIRALDEDCNPDQIVGHVEFCVADFREHSPSWVLDGRMSDAVFINLFGQSQLIHHIQDVPDYEVTELSAVTMKALGVDAHTNAPSRMLIFHRLALLPESRGRKLGLAVLKRIMEKFGAGCEFSALKSYPLQLEYKGDDQSRKFDQRMALGTLEVNEAKARKSLTKYYKSAGFKPVAGTNGLMVKILEM